MYDRSYAIDWITIKGFKSIDSVEKLELKNLNLVIGANGSGKSNFIGIFNFLRHIREGRLERYIKDNGGANKVLYFGSKTTPQLEIQVSFQGKVNNYQLILSVDNNDQLFPKEEKVYFQNPEEYNEPYQESMDSSGNKEAGISNPSSRVQNWVYERLGETWRTYHFHDTGSLSPMKKTCELHDNEYFRPDGANLASFLYFLKVKHDKSYRSICNAIKRVAPFFDDFQLNPQRLNPNFIQLQWKHKKSELFFDASSLSDGTLRFIALATLFLQPEAYIPKVIIVDEPELGLHPYAITILASLIKKVSHSRQLIISTQSSILIDHFTPEDILVADRQGDATQFKRLDSQSLNSFLEEYSLGELWEKNEFGGRPSY